MKARRNESRTLPDCCEVLKVIVNVEHDEQIGILNHSRNYLCLHESVGVSICMCTKAVPLHFQGHKFF